MFNSTRLQTHYNKNLIKYEIGTYQNIFNKWCDWYSYSLKEMWNIFNYESAKEGIEVTCEYTEFCKYIFDKSSKCLKKIDHV
jgi:hypothetical protein